MAKAIKADKVKTKAVPKVALPPAREPVKEMARATLKAMPNLITTSTMVDLSGAMVTKEEISVSDKVIMELVKGRDKPLRRLHSIRTRRIHQIG